MLAKADNLCKIVLVCNILTQEKGIHFALGANRGGLTKNWSEVYNMSHKLKLSPSCLKQANAAFVVNSNCVETENTQPDLFWLSDTALTNTTDSNSLRKTVTHLDDCRCVLQC